MSPPIHPGTTAENRARLTKFVQAIQVSEKDK